MVTPGLNVAMRAKSAMQLDDGVSGHGVPGVRPVGKPHEDFGVEQVRHQS
jgi:hypothetical protein